MDVLFIKNKLVPGLVSIYGDLIKGIILYGSVARGTQTEESDIDIAILLKQGSTKEMYEESLDLIVDLELEQDKVISVVRIDYDKYQEWKDSLPFYRNIEKEGVQLWQAA